MQSLQPYQSTLQFRILLLNFALYFGVVLGQKASMFETIKEKDGLPSNFIFNIVQDHKGAIWLGSDKGLSTYENGKFKTFDTDCGMPGNYINRILPDGKKGLFIYLSEKGLYYFDIQIEKITYQYSSFGPKLSSLQFMVSDLNENYIILAISYPRKLYFAVHRDQLNIVHSLVSDREKGASKYYLKNDATKKIIFNEEQLSKKPVIQQDQYRYEMHYGVGLIKTHIADKSKEIINQNHGLESNLLSSYFQNKNGDLYFSSFGGGINILKNLNRKRSYHIENLNARAINYENGKYYILSNGFLYILDNEKILLKKFLNKNALTLLVDGKTLYLGSFNGLHTYDIKDNDIQLKRTFPLTVGISKIRKIGNKIYFSTYGNGIFEQDGNEFKIKNYPIFNNIENFFENYDGSFTITSYESGFSLLDKNLNFIKNYNQNNGLPSNFVTFTFGEKDSLWVGTKKGLSVFVNQKLVKNFTEAQGFIGHNVRYIFRSNKGDLWIVTNKMVLKKTGKILRPYGSINVLGNKESNIIKSIYWAKLNELALATENNFYLINLDRVHENKNPAEPVFIKFLANGKEQKLSDEYSIEADNYNTEFHFRNVDIDLLGKTELYYQINNEPWTLFNNTNILKFDHLQKGSYLLKFKTINSDGYEKIMKKSIKLTVLPEFYYRLWFIALIFGFFGIIATAFTYLYYNRKYNEKIQEIKLQNQLENERKRISRDLHDNIGAYTTSLIYKVDELKSNRDEVQKNQLDDIRENAENIMTLLRQTIWILGNKNTSVDGFYDYFRNYTLKFLKQRNIKVEFEEDIQNFREMDSTLAISLFRIMQEGLQNIIKHSAATKVYAKLCSKEKIEIILRDNGKGFNLKSEYEGNGLGNMSERAAESGFELLMQSSENGTEIRLKEM